MIKSDSTIFETERHYRSVDRPILVKLFGELDVRYQKTLDSILSDCRALGRPTLVDLSEVTFLDSRCVRELAVHYQVGKGRVALCDPSQEAELSVAACDLEEWIDFVHTTDLGRSAKPRCGEHLSQGGNESKKGTCSCAHHSRQ